MDPPPSLRLATAEDADAIRILVRAAYQRWVPILDREPMPMKVDYAEALTRHRFDLMESGDSLVALIETDSRSDHLWIENIAVIPERQGTGLAHGLLGHAEALARAAGHREVRLLTNGKMRSNRALYTRFGYRETLEEPYLDGTIVYMAKTLS